MNEWNNLSLLNKKNIIKAKSHFNNKKENKTHTPYKNKTEYVLYLEQYPKYKESKKDAEKNVIKDSSGKKYPDTLLGRP